MRAAQSLMLYFHAQAAAVSAIRNFRGEVLEWPEQGCLLSSYPDKIGIGGSNPPLSATSSTRLPRLFLPANQLAMI